MEYSKKLIDLFYETEDYAKVTKDETTTHSYATHEHHSPYSYVHLTLLKVLDHSRELLKFIEKENGFSKETVVLELL